MWMMGYNDGGEDHSFHGRKLRPLIPRPVTSPPHHTTPPPPPCLSRIHHGTDHFLSQYHNLASMAEQGKREFNNNNNNNNTAGVVVSSRWNPTPEQLRALEELYRRGTRTPSAEEIQHITAQLRRFGKIEGKNVFYWFQNHKARERQKRRRQMESSAASAATLDNNILDKEDLLGASRTVFEVEQTKNWPPSTNCSTLAEESVSIERAAKAAIAAEWCRTDGWIQFDGGELHQRKNFMERNATWRMMQHEASNCPPPSSSSSSIINTNTTTSSSPLILSPNSLPSLLPLPITITTTSTTIANTARGSSINSNNNNNNINIATTTTETAREINPIIKSRDDVSFFISSSISLQDSSHINSYNCGQPQTLELFPLRSSGNGSGDDGVNQQKDTHIELSSSAMNVNFTTGPSHFFEFLPLKN